MAVTVESFLESFGQFQGTDELAIGKAITKAGNIAGEAFGVHQDAAIEWLVAHYLSIDPRLENMAPVKGMPGTTTYYQEYLRIVQSARPVGTTSGPVVIIPPNSST